MLWEMVMNQPNQITPGWPGIQPTWTSSAKSGVGTALSPASRVWFTLSHGIIDEVYYPRVDQACTRDLGLIVTDGSTFFSEEKRATHHDIDQLSTGIPAFELTNTCMQGIYTIKKRIFTDPDRDVLLQQTRFTPQQSWQWKDGMDRRLQGCRHAFR
jgi:glucoamylase